MCFVQLQRDPHGCGRPATWVKGRRSSSNITQGQKGTPGPENVQGPSANPSSRDHLPGKGGQRPTLAARVRGSP